jgi:biotin operon repressor
LGTCYTPLEACRKLRCTGDALRHALYRAGKKAPGHYTIQNVGHADHEPPYRIFSPRTDEHEIDVDLSDLSASDDSPRVSASGDAWGDWRKQPEDPYRRLMDACRRGPVSFSELCDRLDLSPKRCAELIDRARAAGRTVQVEHDHVGFSLPNPTDAVVDLGIPPTVGERQMIGVIGDTHFGSKYCMREQIRDFFDYAYSLGVREFFGPGDMLQGHDKKWVFDLSHIHLEG